MKSQITKKIRFCSLLFAAGAFLHIHCADAQVAVDVFAPPESISEHDLNSSLKPFEASGRFQQLYDSSIFSVRFPATPSFIEQVAFRVDAGLGHSFLATLPRVQLNLSTSVRTLDDFRPVFAENIGSDDMVVIPAQSLTLSGSGGGGFSGFSVLFDFHDRPFYYDPSKGDLLLDFRVFEGFGSVGPPQGVAILDAYDVSGGPISSVRAFGDPGTVSTGVTSTVGLTTLLIMVPVPEPSTVALLSLGALLAFGLGRNHSWKG